MQAGNLDVVGKWMVFEATGLEQINQERTD